MATRRQFGRDGAERRLQLPATQLPRQRDNIGTQLGRGLCAPRGKAQADTLRRARTDTIALRRCEATGRPGQERQRARPSRAWATIVLVEAGEHIPSDGDIIEGVASVNESAITAESAPVIREAGGDRSAVGRLRLARADRPRRAISLSRFRIGQTEGSPSCWRRPTFPAAWWRISWPTERYIP
jgi:hypothetical protein